MEIHYRKMLTKVLTIVAACFVVTMIAGCSSDDDFTPVSQSAPPPAAMATFNVTVSNLTNAQPLSPVAVIAHQDNYRVFSVGSASTIEFEQMAEGGDNSSLLAVAIVNSMVMATGSGAAPIGPAGSGVTTIDVPESELPGLNLSVATMLVNTNDAFTGISAVPVKSMAIGDVLSFYGPAYDAGTESDSEVASTIPGPAGGGEGFNAARDDEANRVAMHSGVVSNSDGLATSGLTEQHRFDNPVVRIQIERTD